MSTFIIPDIHGCFRTLKCLLEEYVKPSGSDTLVFLGDYIDRGPNSAGTVGYLIELQQKGFTVVVIRGNHEQMLLNSLYDTEQSRLWMLNGGGPTLESYRSRAGAEIFPLDELIPAEHVSFFLRMPYYHRINDTTYAVHGGIVFPITESEAGFRQMLWLRPWDCEDSIPSGSTVIHGHTPIPLLEVQKQVVQFGRLVNLDAGCVFAKKYPGLGYLTCLNLDSGELLYCENREQ